MIPWWRRLPSRLLEEERALLRLQEGDNPIVLSHRWVRGSDEEPVVFVKICVVSKIIEFEVRFPPYYPEGCPSVRPVPPDMRISTHQFATSGILCLEIGPDNWHPRFTIADMILSAWKLVAYESIKEFEYIEIPSRHVVDLAERIKMSNGVLLQPSELEDRFRAAVSGTEFEVIASVRQRLRVIPAAFPKELPFVLPTALLEHGDRFPGLFIRMREGASKLVPKQSQEFLGFVAEFGQVTLEKKFPFFLLQWLDGEMHGYFLSPKGILELENTSLGALDNTRTPQKLKSLLNELKVGIVGLGSLGSKVSLSLARSGLCHFVLVDGDVMKLENVCRHAATIADIGLMKTEAVEQGLRDVSFVTPEVKRFQLNLGTATNPELHARVLEELGKCNVLVDVTANPEVFGLLAGLASDHQRAIVWGEVFEGGLGGFIASAHPERGPCPRCIRAGFLTELSSWPAAPLGKSDAAYGADKDAPFIATDADVSFIASALVNRIYDLVLREESALPAVMVLGLRRGWVFDSPMQIVPINIRADDWSCKRCWRPESEPETDAARQAEELFSNNADYHNSSNK